MTGVAVAATGAGVSRSKGVPGTVARLLVSVRSADEARAAVAGGASVIDVKEPARGPLGRAEADVWARVVAAVPAGTPVSVALGELREWTGPGSAPAAVTPESFRGLAFRKLGLAGAGPDWAASWARLRRLWADGPAWVAVVYADWERAAAPSPEEVITAALAAEDCAGVLFDTCDKSAAAPIDGSWSPRFERVRGAGKFTALAGGIGVDTLPRLAPLRPDVVAVRGSACLGGDRNAPIDPVRVAALARAARAIGGIGAGG